jgi:predicted transcriptional regulator
MRARRRLLRQARAKSKWKKYATSSTIKIIPDQKQYFKRKKRAILQQKKRMENALRIVEKSAIYLNKLGYRQ